MLKKFRLIILQIMRNLILLLKLNIFAGQFLVLSNKLDVRLLVIAIERKNIFGTVHGIAIVIFLGLFFD